MKSLSRLNSYYSLKLSIQFQEKVYQFYDILSAIFLYSGLCRHYTEGRIQKKIRQGQTEFKTPSFVSNVQK